MPIFWPFLEGAPPAFYAYLTQQGLSYNNIYYFDLTLWHNGARNGSLKTDTYNPTYGNTTWGITMSPDQANLYIAFQDEWDEVALPSRTVTKISDSTVGYGTTNEVAYVPGSTPQVFMVTGTADGYVHVLIPGSGTTSTVLISAGAVLKSIAINPSATEAWIVDQTYGGIRVLDLSTLSVVASVPCPHSPQFVSFTNDGAYAFVTTLGTAYGTIWPVNTSTRAPTGMWGFAGLTQPTVYGSNLYVLNGNNGCITVFDISTPSAPAVSKTIPVYDVSGTYWTTGSDVTVNPGPPPWMVISPDGSTLAILDATASYLLLVNVSTGALTEYATPFTDGVALTRQAPLTFSPDGTKVYCLSQGHVGYLTISGGTWTSTAVAGSQQGNAMALLPSGATLYITSNGSGFGDVNVYNASTLSLTTTIGGTSIYPARLGAMSPDGAHYVAGGDNGAVAIIATASNTVVANPTVAGGNLLSLICSPDSTHVYVLATMVSGAITVYSVNLSTGATDHSCSFVTGASGEYASPGPMVLSPDGAHLHIVTQHISSGSQSSVWSVSTSTWTAAQTQLSTLSTSYGTLTNSVTWALCGVAVDPTSGYIYGTYYAQQPNSSTPNCYVLSGLVTSTVGSGSWSNNVYGTGLAACKEALVSVDGSRLFVVQNQVYNRPNAVMALSAAEPPVASPGPAVGNVYWGATNSYFFEGLAATGDGQYVFVVQMGTPSVDGALVMLNGATLAYLNQFSLPSVGARPAAKACVPGGRWC